MYSYVSVSWSTFLTVENRLITETTVTFAFRYVFERDGQIERVKPRLTKFSFSLKKTRCSAKTDIFVNMFDFHF